MVYSLANLVLGVKLPNYYSMLYRIKKYDPNFIIDPNNFEDELLWKNIKNMNINDIIEYLDRNGEKYFMDDILTYVEEWVKSKFPDFKLVRIGTNSGDGEIYLSYILPGSKSINDDGEYISLSLNDFNNFVKSIDITEFQKLYSILTGKSNSVELSIFALSEVVY